MSDNISRQAAIDIVSRSICPTGDATYDNAREFERESIREELEQLPSADRPKGAWIGIDDYPHEDWECSRCGDQFFGNDAFPEEARFCPSCGADMRGADDESTL